MSSAKKSKLELNQRIKIFLQSVAELLLDYPDSMKMDFNEMGNSVSIEVFVEPSDVGNLLGKSGAIAKSLRHIVFCGAAKEGKRLNIFVMSKERKKVERDRTRPAYHPAKAKGPTIGLRV